MPPQLSSSEQYLSSSNSDDNDNELTTDLFPSSTADDGANFEDIETLVEAADRLINLGLPIVPADGKKPLGKRWHRRDYTIEKIQELLAGAAEPTIGLRMGPDSCIDIEADSPEQEKAFQQLFEGCDVPTTPTFGSSRGPHRLYQWDTRLAKVQKGDCHFIGDDGAELGIRLGAGGKGSQSIIPPSDGRHWIPGLSLEECALAKLPDLVIDRILEAALSHHSPGYVLVEGQTHHARSLKSNTSTRPLPDTAELLTDTAITTTAMCPLTLEQAINATMPSGPGYRNQRIFVFARYLKGMAEYRDRPASELEHVVRKWHAKALPCLGTKEFYPTWMDFKVAWENVHFPIRTGLLAEIVYEALANPFPAAADRYEEPEIRKLVSVCSELQKANGTMPFFLSCRSAADLIGGDENQRTRWNGYLQRLSSDGVIEEYSKGTRGRASEYFYRG